MKIPGRAKTRYPDQGFQSGKGVARLLPRLFFILYFAVEEVAGVLFPAFPQAFPADKQAFARMPEPGFREAFFTWCFGVATALA